MNKNLLFSLWLTLFTLFSSVAWGQTHPAAFNLANANFEFNGFANGNVTSYPASMQGWAFDAEPENTFVGPPTKNQSLVNNTTSATSGNIKNEMV